MKIPIDKAQPGMIVIDKVVNDKGMVLLPPGATLNEALIARLKKWGVQNVTCKDDNAPSENSLSESSNKMNMELEKRIDEKFKPVLDDPIMEVIYKAIKKYYQSQG